MPIWSLTLERLEKLKNQIEAKKAEWEELNALSEKDLWCKDLDDFVDEWEAQLKLDDEVEGNIKRAKRRESLKLGAGKGRKAKKDDDDYAPAKKTTKAVKPKVEKVEKVELKSQQRFLEKFQAKAKPKPTTSSLGGDGASDDEFSDDDFALLGKKPAVKQEVREESDAPASIPDARSKRAAVTKSKYVVDDDDSEMDSDDDFMELGKPKASESASASASEAAPKPTKRAATAKAKPVYKVDDSESDSDDDKMLGDVGAMVKGIGGSSDSNNGGRLSLFSMSRPEGESVLPKLKTKPSKANLDFDSHDDTNYEALAMSSPRKSTKADEIDDFLSDDSAAPAPKASTSQAAASKAKAPLSVVPAASKKARGRPAGSKNKPKDDAPAPKATKAAATKKAPAKTATAKAKPITLSPAAKAYAAKQAKARRVVDSDDEDDDMIDAPPSPIVKPKARPGRAAATKAKPIVIDDDDEDDSLAVDNDDDEDGYSMSD